MSLIRAGVLAIGLLALAGTGVSLAQAPKQTQTEPSTMTKIENWTAKQKATIRRTWAKDKAKWNTCRTLAKNEKWTRTNYWTSQYKCMTS